MAGTGHRYEIANIAEVRDFIGEFQPLAGSDEIICSWLTGRKFLRFVTSDPFVFKATKGTLLEYAEALSDNERPWVITKIEQGRDVRLFSSDVFRRVGPDIRHAIDWMFDLKATAPREFGKIPRMQVEDVFKRVASWIRPRSVSRDLPGGECIEVLKTSDDYVWYELLDAQALAAEGASMSHCVDRLAYTRRLEGGVTRIFSMRSLGGRRLLTMELARSSRRLDADLSVVQIQGFANSAPTDGAIESVCSILNYLSVKPSHSDQERRARISYSPDKGWQSIYKSWKRLVYKDFECISDGAEILFFSPVFAGRPLALVTSTLKGGIRISEDTLEIAGVDFPFYIRLADERHFSIEELRAACSIASLFRAKLHGQEFETTPSGDRLPFIDTLCPKSANGAVYFEDPTNSNAYLTHRSDLALVFAEVGKLPRFPLSEGDERFHQMAARLHNVARWKQDDMIRCLNIMTDVGATSILAEKEAMRGLLELYEPIRTKNGVWRAFLLDARRRETNKPGWVWLETEYRIALTSDGRRTVHFDIDGNHVTDFPFCWSRNLDLAMIAARLNSLKLSPSDNIRCSSVGDPLPLTRAKGVGRLLYLGGRWRVVRSQRDLVKLAEHLRPTTKGEARLIVHSLPDNPEHREAALDRIYAKAYVMGMLAGGEADPYLPNGDGSKPLVWLSNNLSLLDPPMQKILVAHVSRILSRWSRQPKSFYARIDDHEQLFFGVRPHLKVSVINSVIKHIFKKNHHWLGSKAIDITWVREIFPALTDTKTRAALYRAISNGASGTRGESNPSKLLVSAACLQVYARHEYILLDHKRDSVESAYQALVEQSPDHHNNPVMLEVRSMLDSILDRVNERLEAQAERQRALDELFTRTRGTAEFRAAA